MLAAQRNRVRSGSPIQRRILFGTLALAAAIVPFTFGAKGATAQSDELVPVVRVAALLLSGPEPA
jgi:hypothetical protein